MDDKVKLDRSVEHVWKYFELHSQQRMTVFNFFLAIAGLVGAGIGFGLQQGAKFSVLTSCLGVFLSFISFLFWKLDQRVSVMIKAAELAIIKLERFVVVDDAIIFSLEQQSLNKSINIFSIWTYGRCFRVAFFCMGLVGAVFSIVPYLIGF